MPKTLLLTHFFSPSIGGIEEYYRHVVEHVPAGELIVLTQATPEAPNSNDQILRVNFFSKNFRPRWLPWLWRFPQLIRRHGIQQLWIGHLSPLTPLAWCVARWRGLPVLLSIHGADLLIPERHRLSRWITQWILRHTNLIVANSEFLAHELRRRGVAEENIVIIPPGVSLPTPPTPAEQESTRRQFGVDQFFTFLTVARLVKRKAVDRLIEAIARLSRDLPNLFLVIIGDGPERSTLEALVSERGVGQRVRFLGARAADDPEKLGWFRAANAFALVTRAAREGKDIESYGIVYREAQAASLPVIASELGGATEIVRTGTDGFLIPENDDTELDKRMAELASRPDLCARFAREGRAVAEQHTWEVRWPLLDAALQMQPALEKPLVSVILPCWNVAELLPKTLTSIAKQSYPNIEIIAVDDGSTDSTPDVLRSIGGLRVLTQPNQGAAAARNLGAKNARGEFLLFCDADVILKPNAITSFVRLLQLHPDRAFAYAAFRLGWRSFYRIPFDAERLRRYNYVNTVSLLRTAQFPGFDETLRRYQDWDLWLTIVERGGKGIGTAEYLFRTASRPGITRKAGTLPHRDLIDRLLRRPMQKQFSTDRLAFDQIRQKHNLP